MISDAGLKALLILAQIAQLLWVFFNETTDKFFTCNSIKHKTTKPTKNLKKGIVLNF